MIFQRYPASRDYQNIFVSIEFYFDNINKFFAQLDMERNCASMS